MTSQPRFWLKVTPAYVIENFEELLRYVNEYNYSIAEPEDSDFNVTVDCLCNVADNIINQMVKLSLEEKMEVNQIDTRTSIRIIASAMVSEYKRGKNCHYYILALIRMLILNIEIPFCDRHKIISLIRNCALKSSIGNMSVHLADIFAENFFEPTLYTRVVNIEFEYNQNVNASHEGHGTVLFKDDRIEIVPMNLDQLRKSYVELRPEIKLDSGIYVCEKKVKKLVSDIEMLSDIFPKLINEFNSVKPSTEKKLKEYSSEDQLDVVIKIINGVYVQCESVDLDYQKVSGKLYIDRGPRGLNREQLLSQLKPGDILPAIYSFNENCEFSLCHDYDDDFIKANAEYHIGESMDAIFQTSYTFGSRWQTEYGLFVNILNSNFKEAGFIDVDYTQYKLKIKIKEYRRDAKGNLVINGEPLPISEQTMESFDEIKFREIAIHNFAHCYLDFFREPSDEHKIFTPVIFDNQALKTSVETLGLLLVRLHNVSNSESTFNRMNRMAVAALLMKISGRDADFDIARREFDYIHATADFAVGKSPISLNFNPSSRIKDFPRSKVEGHIIEVLRSYRESAPVSNTSNLLIGEQFSMVEQLVAASNILIDKIDLAEISRIKKNIVTKLGVADMYNDINQDRSFYGMESDNLEFKISCAQPPESWSTGSEREDINVQRFNILRTVCAFLNSQSGGDLLIGVNDEGYAVGLENDIRLLSRYHFILEPNIDRLSVYIKNQIDTAFFSDDGSAHGNAITTGNVIVNIEESSDRKKILRVKINPYPYDVVHIKPEFCLKDSKDVFIRSSATSISLKKDGIRNARIRKLKTLDKNEVKIARILEAIDNKQIILLKSYQSHNGLTNRYVEPHCLALGQNAFQAFDHSSKQMRLFKISRITDIEVQTKKWEYPAKHKTHRIDIFGMMESDTVTPLTVILKMAAFAYMLLKEEYPIPSDPNLFEVKTNTGVDAKTFPYIVKLLVFHSAGYSRFVKGLPELIQVIHP